MITFNYNLHGLSIDRLDRAFCTFGQMYKTYRNVQKVRPVRLKRKIRRSCTQVVQN